MLRAALAAKNVNIHAGLCFYLKNSHWTLYEETHAVFFHILFKYFNIICEVTF